MNTNMVLPNVTQLYFKGFIEEDAINRRPKFQSNTAESIYNILVNNKSVNLGEELKNKNIQVTDDMILLEVGQRLQEEKKTDEALSLYQYYTTEFPNIVVAWNDMGDIYQMKGNKEEARKCYKEALKLKPENPRAKQNLEKLESD